MILLTLSRALCNIRKDSGRIGTVKQVLKLKEAITHWVDKWERITCLFARTLLPPSPRPLGHRWCTAQRQGAPAIHLHGNERHPLYNKKNLSGHINIKVDFKQRISSGIKKDISKR